MSLNHSEAVIANTADTTGVIDVTDQVLVSIHMPANFDGTKLSILGARSATGTFVPVKDAAGTALEVTISSSTVAVVAPDSTRGLRYIKLKSDAAQSPAITLDLGLLPDDRT